jgi:serine protease Do
MSPKSKWLGLSALGLLVASYVVVFSSAGFGQSQPPATNPGVRVGLDAVPYTTQANSKITSLKAPSSFPRNVSDLKTIQDRVEAVFKQVLPATVAIRIVVTQPETQPGGRGGGGRGAPVPREVEEGSGVIVSKDGYVLTAGHVSGRPGTPVSIILSNGRTVLGVAMGANNLVDSGMIKIDNNAFQADYPYVPLGESASLSKGQWVLALGHPGGYQPTRPPVLRIGRVLDFRSTSRGRPAFIQTDCELIMGDSGGPVFDLNGNLIAINSRIGVETSANIHVPIDSFKQDWVRLAKGEEWGSRTGPFYARGGGPDNSMATPPKASLGIQYLNDPNGPVVIQTTTYGRAADRAGLQADDVITKFDGKVIKSEDDLKTVLGTHKPGDKVSMEFKRDGSIKTVTVTLDAGQP